jgi:hypothetical protein
MALDKSDKYVKLKNANVNVRLVEIKKDESGHATELVVEHDEGKFADVKIHPIHWVPLVVCFNYVSIVSDLW